MAQMFMAQSLLIIVSLIFLSAVISFRLQILEDEIAFVLLSPVCIIYGG